MRISDWSSDVCSSDLDLGLVDLPGRPATYAEWDAIDMAELFEEPFDLPVFVENDAAAAAMGEMQLGLGQTLSSFFYILIRSEEHTSELQSLMRISYAVFFLNTQTKTDETTSPLK